jgi:hypothetical protein
MLCAAVSLVSDAAPALVNAVLVLCEAEMDALSCSKRELCHSPHATDTNYAIDFAKFKKPPKHIDSPELSFLIPAPQHSDRIT